MRVVLRVWRMGHDMRLLQPCPAVSNLPDVLPLVPVVRRPADSGDWPLLGASFSGFATAQKSAGRLGSARPLGGGDSLSGQRPTEPATVWLHNGRCAAIRDWPGRAIGIRPPDYEETPLSDSEALQALRDGVIYLYPYQY